LEFELTVRGTPEELQRAISLLGDISNTPQVPTWDKSVEDVQEPRLNDYLHGLNEEARDVLTLIVDKSLNPEKGSRPGATDAELTAKLHEQSGRSRKPFGVIGGLGRRWTSVIGGSSRSPFRKDREGEEGRYVIDKELAEQIRKGLEASRN